MAIAKKWTIEDTTWDVSTGGVEKVVWRCIAISDTEASESAYHAGKFTYTPDSSDAGFVALDDLDEAKIIVWVKATLDASTLTSTELETKLEDKVKEKIAKNTTHKSGRPYLEKGE